MTPILETGWDLFLFSFRGAFINHVDHILHNFDPPSPSSCPRCYLMPPSKSIWFKCAFLNSNFNSYLSLKDGRRIWNERKVDPILAFFPFKRKENVGKFFSNEKFCHSSCKHEFINGHCGQLLIWTRYDYYICKSTVIYIICIIFRTPVCFSSSSYLVWRKFLSFFQRIAVHLCNSRAKEVQIVSF